MTALTDSSAPSPAPRDTVRVRFCPSPTGTPHVGLIRTALFNWAHARHTGGTFVFRIEDTDAARDSEESYLQLLDAMRWLGLDWDEGVEVGGPHGPYRQSQRGDIYADVVDRLVAAGLVYESFSTPEEIEARHRAAGRDPKLGYDNADRDLTAEQRAALRAEGRLPVLRLRMPDEDITFDDLVRGQVTFRAGSVADYVVVRAGGDPLYTLVNPVDDALMEITHVLRGEDLLSSTPRQIALYRALVEIGVAKDVPRFGHLPYVMGEGNRKLSKRDPASDLFLHRSRGFVPEGLLNYLALLGWAIAEDRDVFTMEEMVAAFDISDVNANPARFDLRKAEAINAEHLRRLAPEDFRERLVPYLQAADVAGRAHAVPARGARGGRTADPDPGPGALGGTGHARFPVRSRRGPGAGRGRHGRRRQGRPGRAGGPHRGRDGAGGPDRLAGRGDRVRPAVGAGGGTGAEAEGRLHPGPGRGHRAPGLATALRVHGDPRQAELPRQGGRARHAARRDGDLVTTRAGTSPGRER